MGRGGLRGGDTEHSQRQTILQGIFKREWPLTHKPRELEPWRLAASLKARIWSVVVMVPSGT
jgi:hypothetical protein